MTTESEHKDRSHIGWLRAILTATGIVAVGIVVCVYGANLALTKMHSITRSQRVAVATTVFFVGLFVIAWGLRQLQKRNLI